MAEQTPGSARVVLARGVSIVVPIYPLDAAAKELPNLAGRNDIDGVHAPILLCGSNGAAQLAVLPYALFGELTEIIEDVRIMASILQREAEDTGERISIEEALHRLGLDSAAETPSEEGDEPQVAP